ncbi:acetyltransferase (GNAT) family protein [Algoriphagus ratkowskyi]|uniref:Acetyltransferase (GNAT) family protein n=1 Tax=Algoriphagus ratkowskyi TaxID=57028 RepID=A0A2W7SBW2_9BACT|nr:GNAT family N-acetyltransferase [Algoriphagus ratkowskyi]PZX60355.1 acetyltransferase (GNAT) family protein [Algoriphagus ratkowskyi]TXD78172.1 GNAT family N-acetyltransferase [Algoriphagus ratkowskyi]
MITLTRTDSSNPDFIALVTLLDAYLAEKDGRDHDYYNQFNTIDKLKHVVVCYESGIPIACGAIKQFDADSMEVKRMFTKPEARGKGLASQVLAELEKWAAELGYKSCVLETGKRQVEAVALYKKQDYSLIPNYGQYRGMDNSICFKKVL